MPQIQEYLPQTQAQEPVGGVSPNVEMAGAVGRGIQNLGQDVMDAGALIHRRAVQKENATTFEKMADARADWTDRVQSGIQDGSLDVDKMQESFDDETQNIGDNVETSEGQNYFTRQQARLRGNLLTMANKGMAQIAGRQAKAQLQQGTDQLGMATRRDPGGWQDSMDSVSETVDQFIKDGGLPEAMRPQAEKELGSTIAQNAIRGFADSDPALAKKELNSGRYDDYLSPEQYKQMNGEVDTAAKAKEVEDRRTDRSIKDSQKAASEAFGQQAVGKLTTGSLTTKDVLNSQDLDWKSKQYWIHAIDSRNKEQIQKSDPRTFIDLANRITGTNPNNPIESTEDLLPYMGKGLNADGLNKLVGLINKAHPEIAQGDKQVMKTLQSTIRFKNPMTNQWDLAGEQKLSQAMHDYSDAKKNVKSQGGTLHDLVDPSSKFYFASDQNMAKYQTSIQDQLSHFGQDRTDKALGLPRDGHDNANSTPPKNVRQPNESAADFLKRKGLGG